MIEIKDIKGNLIAEVQADTLRGADLRTKCLEDADFRGADLRGADLRRVMLRGADFTGADLRDALLENADMKWCGFDGAKLPDFQIPQEGDLIGWKFVTDYISTQWSPAVCKLLIPDGARRTACLVSNKCRAERAEVLDIRLLPGLETSPKLAWARSCHRPDFRYRVGEMVFPDRYSGDIGTACDYGIHFFIAWIDAVTYM